MSNPRKSSDSTKDAVEALTILIESQGIDITANYSDWLRIAFNTSIASKAHIPL